jgi:threonine dehydrogenase-like Zn-dependent dehydrogenase
MKALVWRGKKSLSVVDDQPVPLVTDPTDAVVRVVKAAICGSDIHLFCSSMPGMKSGDVMGHECMGVVSSVGPGVKSVAVGDRVTVSFDLACGSCWFCDKGLFTACDVTNPSVSQGALYGQRTSGALGYSHLTGGHWGCHADYVRVPFADTNLLPLGEVEREVEAAGSGGEIAPAPATGKITDDQAALLGDVLPTGWTACELGEVGKGDFVCIFGAGPIGLVTAQCAAHRGARRIVLVDPVAERLAFARKPGVVLRGQAASSSSPSSSSSSSSCRLDTVHVPGSGTAGLEAALKEVARLSEGEPAGAPDVAVEAVGMHYARGLHHRLQMAVGMETDSAEALNACLRCVRKGGRVSVVGVFAGSANGFLLGTLFEKGVTVRGSQAPVQKYWRELAAKVARGELDPSVIATHHFSLDDAPEAFRLFDEKRDGCVKVILDVAAGAAAAAPSSSSAARAAEGGIGEEVETVQDVPVVALT